MATDVCRPIAISDLFPKLLLGHVGQVGHRHGLEIVLPRAGRPVTERWARAACSGSVSVPPDPGRQRKVPITNHRSITSSGAWSRTQVLITEARPNNTQIYEGTDQVRRI